MSRWVTKKIGEFAYTSSGGTPSTDIKEYWAQGTIPWINSGELSQNDFIKSATTFISEEALKNSSAKLMPINTVVIALTGATTGMSALLEIETSGNQSITGIYPSKKHDPLFLLYWLHQNINTIVGFNIGSAQPHINKGIVDNLNIFMPEEVAEQEAISKIIRNVHKSIEQTEDLIAKYQRIKTGLMHDLLTRGIDEHGNIRSEQTHSFKTEKGLRVPEEWDVSTIGTYIERIEQGWSPDCEGEPAPSDEWGVLKTTSVTWDGYNENENKKLPDKLIPKTHYEIKEGDVLITRGGPNSRVGVVAFVEKTRNKLILCDKIYRLTPKANLLAEFLSIALSSSTTQTHLSNLKTGMAESQTNISQKIVEALSILIPNPSEQKTIIDRLKGIDKLLKQNQINLRKLKSLKTGLMEDLLSGKVRVKIKVNANTTS